LVVGIGHAQTIDRTIDLSHFGWGWVEAYPADTDGIPATEEWAVRSFTTGQWRVIAVRASLCIGPWFTPTGYGPFAGVSVVTVGGRSQLRVGTGQLFTLVSLDTPTCP